MTEENTLEAVRDRSLARALDLAWHDTDRLTADVVICLKRIDDLETLLVARAEGRTP